MRRSEISFRLLRRWHESNVAWNTIRVLHMTVLKFKLAVTVYTSVSLHGLAGTTVAVVDSIQRIADTARRKLCSSSTETLVVHHTRLVTAGDRAFFSFGCRLWNSLPHDVTYSPLHRNYLLFDRIFRLSNCLHNLCQFDLHSDPCRLGSL